jgi:glutamine cyclotransferase
VEEQLNYPEHIFAEGVTVYEGSIYQLTWKNKKIFQYDQEDFSLIRAWPYPREGWGLTHDTQHLILSDGSSSLYFLDPKDLSEQRRITVRDGEREIMRLNELEYIKGTLYANVWTSTKIALIDPQDGRVQGWLDLTELSRGMQKPAYRGEDSLNGIMYDPENNRIFVTGKLWPLLFEIELVPAEATGS